MNERYGPGHPYPVRSLTRARELASLGWQPPAIHRMMTAEGIPTPNVRTIHKWVDERRNEKDLAATRRSGQRARASEATFRLGGARGEQGATPAYRAEFIATLLRIGVGRADVEKVCDVVLGGPDATVERRGRGRPSRRHKWSAATTERVLSVSLEMRKRKVPYSAICVALELCEGVAPMNPNTLRHWLVMHGAERDASRSRRTTMANIGQQPRAMTDLPQCAGTPVRSGSPADVTHPGGDSTASARLAAGTVLEAGE